MRSRRPSTRSHRSLEADPPARFKTYVLDIESAGCIFLRTLSGRANAVAAALDEWQPPGVLGTLAGDEAVSSVVVRAEDEAPRCRKWPK